MTSTYTNNLIYCNLTSAFIFSVYQFLQGTIINHFA